MILVPDKFIYLAAPRTGSRTTVEALRKYCGGRKISKTHHASRAELERLITDLPIYSMIRDPLDFFQAAWAKSPIPHFNEFIRSWNPDSLGEWNGRMAPYAGFVTHYFLYESGLEDFFERVGFGGVSLTNKGRGERKGYKPLSEADRDQVRIRYAVDFERYELWRDANSRAMI